jgi:ferredoxin
MSQSEQHRTIKQFRVRQAAGEVPVAPQVVDASWLRSVCLEAGADDVGFVEVNRPEVAGQKADIDLLVPGAKTLISIVKRMNRDNVRPPTRSVANLEFHHSTHDVNHIARKIVAVLAQKQIRAVNLIDVDVTEYNKPLDYNPCLECKLCVAACPTGAISSDGHFNFSACYTHNYREFMGGFIDWVHAIADSGSVKEYRKRVSAPESVSMWQSLSFGATTRRLTAWRFALRAKT